MISNFTRNDYFTHRKPAATIIGQGHKAVKSH